MSNIIHNFAHQIDPQAGTTTIPYIATLAYNFAVQFGVFPFFLLVLIGAGLTAIIFFFWNKFNNKKSSLTIKDIELLITTAQQPTIEKITQILDNIRSHLKADEVIIVLRLAENYMCYEMVNICKNIQLQDKLNEDQIKEELESQIEKSVLLLDRELIKLPGIDTSLISSEAKIASLKNQIENLIDIIKTDTRYDTLVKSCESLVKLTAAREWYR